MSVQPLSVVANQDSALRLNTVEANRSPRPSSSVQPPTQSTPPEEAKGLQPKDVNRKSLEDAAKTANEAIQGLRSDLKFTVDEETGINVVKFIDVNTKEVIRQIPAQEMLEIAKRLDELQGLLIKESI